MIYQKATSPQNIIRIAVHFINRFDFTGETILLEDYLKIFPHFPEKCLMKSFSMQAILNQEDLNSTLIITQALMSPIKPNTIANQSNLFEPLCVFAPLRLCVEFEASTLSRQNLLFKLRESTRG
jgi:hypothetical protein